VKLRRFIPATVALTLAAAACSPAAAPSPSAPAPSPSQSPPASASPSPQETVTITFWNYWDAKNGEVMAQLVDEFNKSHPNIQVNNVYQPSDHLMTLFQTSIAAGTTPDVAAGDLIWVPQLVATGGLEPLDDYVAKTQGFDVDDFYPRLAGYDVIGGRRYALPVSTNNMQLIWNKDLFAKAGLDPDKPPRTWDEMQALAERCQDPSAGVVGFEFFTQPPGEGITWQFQVWLWTAGGEFLNADNTRAAFNTPEGLKALTFVSEMLKGKGSRPGPWGLFGEQKACMQLDGSWLFGYRKDAPFKWDIAPVPAPAGGTTASNVGGEHIFMFANSPHKDAAWEFIQYLVSPDVQLKWDKETGFLPVRKSVGENPDYLKWVRETEPRMLPFVEGMPFAHTRPATPLYNQVSDAFSREIQKALLGQASPQDALASAEAAVNAVLQQ
jgi:multiple sugar transport system substrate-binding protein